MYLQDISQQLTIYVGICLFIAGIIGNGINIWIFIGKRSYRTTPCTFYFLIESIYNILIVCISLSDRILNIGFDVDIKHESNLWCKIRQFSLAVLSPLSITCSCLAMIDQFLVTSRSQSLRNCSQMKWTYRKTILLIYLNYFEPKLAVYDETSIMEKYHQTLATNRPEIDLKRPLRFGGDSESKFCFYLYLGIKSTPCCINAAKAKNKVFKIENLFDNCGVVSSSILHSYGEKRETRNKITLTPMYANVTHIQISPDNGAINEKIPLEENDRTNYGFVFVNFKPGFGFSGLLIKMLMPRFIHGLLKSTTLSR